MNSAIYKRKTESERKAIFEQIEKILNHSVVNLKAPKNKNEIKNIRKDSGLSCGAAGAICGVTRRTWTMWENYKKNSPKDEKPETYPSDWQWGWFLLAVDKHPKLRLVENSPSDGDYKKFTPNKEDSDVFG